MQSVLWSRSEPDFFAGAGKIAPAPGCCCETSGFCGGEVATILPGQDWNSSTTLHASLLFQFFECLFLKTKANFFCFQFIKFKKDPKSSQQTLLFYAHQGLLYLYFTWSSTFPSPLKLSKVGQDPESGSVSNDKDLDPTKTIKQKRSSYKDIF